MSLINEEKNILKRLKKIDVDNKQFICNQPYTNTKATRIVSKETKKDGKNIIIQELEEYEINYKQNWEDNLKILQNTNLIGGI